MAPGHACGTGLRRCGHLSRPDRRGTAQFCSIVRLECIRARMRLFLSSILDCSICAALSLPICIIRCRSSTGCSRPRRQFDLVIFAGDALDVGSIVDFRAQIVVVKKYLALLSERTRVILCSGNHDLDERSPEGEKISRWVGEVRELGIACDGDSLAIGDTLFTVCPWWDGPLVKARIDMPASRSRGQPAQPMDLGASRAAGEFADQLGRQAVLRRRRTGAMDRALPAVDGDLRPCAPVALHPRWFVVRPARLDLGVQHRAAARPAAGLHRARHRRRQGVLAGGRRRAGHRPRRRRCSGRPRRSNIRRPGSHPWVGLPIRSWRDLHRRQVDHALQESRRPSRDGCRGRHIGA